METIVESTETKESTGGRQTSLRAGPSPKVDLSIEIVEVKNNRELKEFLSLPQHIYTDPDTRYVFPLNLHMKMMIGKLGSPEKHFLIARKNGKIVARMAAKVHQHEGKKTLNFGFFESLEGQDAAVSMLVENLHSRYPHLKMMGPFQFRMEDPYIGVLVEGYDRDPYFLMPYNPTYYDALLNQAGLSKVMDLYTHQIETPHNLDPILVQNAEKAASKGVTIRALNPKKLNEEARNIARIFNDALSKNWGFEEFLDEQVKEMVMLFKLFIDHRVVVFAQLNGVDVGCLLMIPNYNPIIKEGRGRITPGLILNYFRRKKITNTIRGYALGVLKDYHGYGIGSALTKALFDKGPTVGYNTCEVSWVLANNGPMNELSKAMGAKHSKVYRVYEKSPTAL